MNHINPDAELLKHISKLSKYELKIILKNYKEFIKQIKKTDKIHLKKQEKALLINSLFR
jgi:hypothetical protein